MNVFRFAERENAEQIRERFGDHVHPDDWKWAGYEHYRWREHVSHGSGGAASGLKSSN